MAMYSYACLFRAMLSYVGLCSIVIYGYVHGSYYPFGKLTLNSLIILCHEKQKVHECRIIGANKEYSLILNIPKKIRNNSNTT